MDGRRPDIGKFTDALQVETDRGCVVVANAWIEAATGRLLQRKFEIASNASKATCDSILAHEKRGPLAFVTDRAKVLLALGIINNHEYGWIKRLAALRNEFFAHDFVPITLESEWVAASLKQFMDSGDSKDIDAFLARWDRSKDGYSDARRRFMVCAWQLCLCLEVRFNILTGSKS